MSTATKAVTVIVPDEELDIAFDEGFLREWLSKDPPRCIDALQTLVDGIAYYRKKNHELKEEIRITNERYNALLIQSAQHLQFMAQQKDLLDEALASQQREFHGHGKDFNDGFTRSG